MNSILCFGDSNTYGLIPGTKERYGYGVRWTSILSENLKDKNYRVIEEGLCGRTTIFDDATRIGRKADGVFSIVLESHNPIELVIIMLGTNDCKSEYNASPEIIGSGVDKLINQAKAIVPNAKILLVSPIALGDGVWENEFDPEFNEASVDVSKALKKIYGDIARKEKVEFLAASEYVGPCEIDREHLDEAGHKKFGQVITEKVSEILKIA